MSRRSEDQNYESGVLSTYNAADLCNVAPITFRKWCTNKEVGGAFQSPDSREWKITAPDMLTFLLSRKMPVKSKLFKAIRAYRSIYNRDGSENKIDTESKK